MFAIITNKNSIKLIDNVCLTTTATNNGALVLDDSEEQVINAVTDNDIHHSILHTDLPVWDHECPSVTHLNLKRLIQNIVSEALKLPNLFNHSGVPPRPEEHVPFFDPKKYEQLVATAVLNKVSGTFRVVVVVIRY